MNRTTLYETHVDMGARMVPFAGWEMPVQYASPIEEHKAVRAAAGLFDIDHMGQFIVSGPGALDFLQWVITSDVSALGPMEAGYGLMCYDDGGTIDDVFVYNDTGRGVYFVVVNASNRDKDLKWMRLHSARFAVTIEDVSEATYMLAFQGPKAQAILQTLTDLDLDTVPFHGSAHGAVAGVECYMGNTGYTGEYGYELFFDAAQAPHVWNAILEAGQPEGAVPVGLAARDSLRFEACLPLYGHELSNTISPLEVGLGFAVKFDKPIFIGRDALLKQKLEKPARRLACVTMTDKGVPREHYPAFIIDEEGVEHEGFVTTGMYAPSVDLYAAMVLIPRHLYKVGATVEIEIRGRRKAAEIVKRPFYTPAYRR